MYLVFNHILQPEHVLLLGVVRCHGSLGVGKVNGELAPKCVIRLASVGLLIFVEDDLISFQDNTQLFPGSK